MNVFSEARFESKDFRANQYHPKVIVLFLGVKQKKAEHCNRRLQLFAHLFFDEAHDGGENAAATDAGKHLGDDAAGIAAGVEHIEQLAAAKAADHAGDGVPDGAHIEFFKQASGHIAAGCAGEQVDDDLLHTGWFW